MSYYPISRVERIKDLRRILTDRWGPRLPNDETGRRLLAIVADHALLVAPDLAEKMMLQLAPAEISDAEISYMIDRAGEGRMWGVQALAVELGLTEAERLRLGFAPSARYHASKSQDAQKGAGASSPGC